MDQDQYDRRPEGQVKISLFWQALLAATLYGLESAAGFFQIFAILFLQYMGVPVSLLSLDGIMSGVFCVCVMPAIGYLTDKGANPKTRKWWALLFGNGLFLLGILLFVAATSLNIQTLIKKQEYLNHQQRNGLLQIQNSTTMTQKNERLTIRGTPMDISALNDSSGTSSASLWPTNAPQVWGLPVTAVLGILCVSIFNIAYDSSLSISRAFILVCMPNSQQSSILITATVMQSLGGTIYSLLGVLDLPRILGPLFGVDSVSIFFLLFAVYMFVCVSVGFIITSVASYHVERKMKGFERLADKLKSECDNHELSVNKNRTVCCSESAVNSHNFVKGTMNGIEDRESIPILPNENSNSECRSTYSSYMSVTPGEQSMSNTEHNRNFIGSQSLLPKEKDDTKLRLNKKLVVLCLGHFFAVGGLLPMVEYMPNTLTIGIYHGDPTALPGTEEHALYQKGLNMAALGNLLVYVTYLMMSLGTKRLLRYIDTEGLHVILSSSSLVAFAAFLIFQHEALYFVSAVVFGPYRTCLYIDPYLLAAIYSKEKQVNPQRQARNIGKVMALIGILMPLHYLFMSTFMGPAMDKTDNVWFPLYYSFANFCLSFLFFCLLLYWSRVRTAADG